jgi:hypothetical protein
MIFVTLHLTLVPLTLTKRETYCVIYLYGPSIFTYPLGLAVWVFIHLTAKPLDVRLFSIHLKLIKPKIQFFKRKFKYLNNKLLRIQVNIRIIVGNVDMSTLII